MNIPKAIKDIIGNQEFYMDAIGKSDSSLAIFCDRVLKIEKQCKESDNEHRIMEWLDNKALFDKLGIAPDYEKLRYYILLDELF